MPNRRMRGEVLVQMLHGIVTHGPGAAHCPRVGRRRLERREWPPAPVASVKRD